MGSSPLDSPIQDGTTLGEWDTSQGLVSALGGQDMHALQFAGAEIQPALSGSAIVLEQNLGGSGTWVSHPSAIGYRRAGLYRASGGGGSGSGGGGSGSGGSYIAIAAVAPEFDSGMNQGTDQDEMERLENFSQGAQENPTVAQSQPTSRAAQQTAVVGPGGEPLFTPEGPTTSNVGNSMNVGGYTGYALVQQFAWILGPLGFLPPGFGDGGNGIPNADGSGTDNSGANLASFYGNAYGTGIVPGPTKGAPATNRRSPGDTVLGPPVPPPAPPPPPASPDPGQPPGPSPGVSAPSGPVEQAPGAQIDPAQPTPPQANSGGALDYAASAAQQVLYGNYVPVNPSPWNLNARVDGGWGKMLSIETEGHIIFEVGTDAERQMVMYQAADAAYRQLKSFSLFNSANKDIASVKLVYGADYASQFSGQNLENRRFAGFYTVGWTGWASRNVTWSGESDGRAYVELFYDDASRTVTAFTLGNHMLIGVRKWHVTAAFQNGQGVVTLSTAAWEQRNSLPNDAGFWYGGGLSATHKIWQNYLDSIGQGLEKQFPSGVWWTSHSSPQPLELPSDSPNPWKGMKTGWSNPIHTPLRDGREVRAAEAKLAEVVVNILS